MKTYRGFYRDHQSWVWVMEDGKETPLPAIAILTSRPPPFDWGYGWKGPRAAVAPAPATLAYSLLYDAFGQELAQKYWLQFLATTVCKLDVEQPWKLSTRDLNAAIAGIKKRMRRRIR